MAFKMNRPIIKGTANHKASVAKATSESIVSQRRTQADASLVGAADALGKSYIPQAIDFELDKMNIDVPEKKKKKKKKEKQPKVKKSKSDYGSYEEYLAEEKELQKNIDDKDYQAYLDQESGSGTSDENLPSREQWEKNLKKPSYKPLSKKDWTDLNVEAGMKRPKVKKEKQPRVKRESFWDRMRKKRELQKTKSTEEKLNERLRKAEEGPDSDYDFSELDNEPSAKTKKTEKYKSPEAGTKEGEELLSRTKAGRNKALQDAAKKYNVKVEDLVAKEIGGKREFFPKQSAVGGSYGAEGGGAGSGGTQWDDELGRFRIPTGGISGEKYDKLSDEQKKAYDVEMTKRETDLKAEMEALRPKQDNIKQEDLGDLPSMVNSGDIALNPVTNQYEYTEQYLKRHQPKVVKPVVEENKTTTSNARQRRLDKKWESAGPSVRANMIADGYVPDEGKSAMQMRDNRIYRNAVKGGTVQQNMIKSGYKPE